MRPIKAHTLRDMLECSRRVWLDAHGDPAVRAEPPPNFAQARGRSFEIFARQRYGSLRPVFSASWDESVAVTRDLMAQGVRVIAGASLERPHPHQPDLLVRGKIDLLVRAVGSSRDAALYFPVEVKTVRELRTEDRLQLDCYLWLLESDLGGPEQGEFWLPGRPPEWIDIAPHRYDEDRLFDAFRGVGDVLRQESAPPIYLTGHCDSCSWHTHCRTAANAEGAITLLNGLSRRSWESLIAAGLHTVDQVADQPPEALRRLKGIGPATVHQLISSARALRDRDAVLLRALPEELFHPIVMLDIETGLSFQDQGIPWSYGWSGVDGDLYAAVVARYTNADQTILPDGRPVRLLHDYAEGWRMIADYAEAHDALVYHWSGYDSGIMRQTAPPDVAAILNRRMRDLLQVFKQCVMLPVRGRSIKTVAAYLGYAYPPASDYAQAWNDYRRWQMDNDHTALQRAMAYQLADVEAMLIARDWLVRRASGEA
ncbi:MAG: TM0106 family RecB-like putative nuclease [Anaerolineae bacterium]|nr:TM0106 family RecB-like putative nuclease [Anaerolineae bacterium]NUQ04104.1 TM0106 family RecB-like putative nuclease [Anaerolineae bacterium]